MAGLGAKDILRNVTALEQLIEEINFQRAKEMRQCLMSKDAETGFVVVHGTTYWTDLFVRHFLFQTDRCTDADDLLFFIRKKHIRGSRHIPKYHTEVEVYRKDSRKLPIGDPDIDWEETVYLNLIIHQFDYTLTLAVCTRTSPKDLQVLRRHSQKVYASPSRRRMDTKGEVEEITYPNVCFHVDNFDEVFCDMQVRDGEMVCVELVAADHSGTRQAVIFLGSIRYDALKRVYDARASLSSKVAQRMMMGLFSGSNNQRIEFVRMKGPLGKGHAEMAVTKPKGSGVETPTSEPGVSLTDLWDCDWEDEPEDRLLYRHQRRLSDPSANFNTFINSGWRARGMGAGGGQDVGRSRSENEGLDSFADGLYEIESGDVRDGSLCRCCIVCGAPQLASCDDDLEVIERFRCVKCRHFHSTRPVTGAVTNPADDGQVAASGEEQMYRGDNTTSAVEEETCKAHSRSTARSLKLKGDQPSSKQASQDVDPLAGITVSDRMTSSSAPSAGGSSCIEPPEKLIDDIKVLMNPSHSQQEDLSTIEKCEPLIHSQVNVGENVDEADLALINIASEDEDESSTKKKDNSIDRAPCSGFEIISGIDYPPLTEIKLQGRRNSSDAEESEEEPEEFEPLLTGTQQTSRTRSQRCLTKTNSLSDVPEVQFVHPQTQSAECTNSNVLGVCKTPATGFGQKKLGGDVQRALKTRTQSLDMAGTAEILGASSNSPYLDTKPAAGPKINAFCTLPRTKSSNVMKKPPGTAVRVSSPGSQGVCGPSSSRPQPARSSHAVPSSSALGGKRRFLTSACINGTRIIYRDLPVEDTNVQGEVDSAKEATAEDDESDASEAAEASILSPLLQKNKLTRRRKISMPYRIAPDGTTFNFICDIKLDDGAYNPLWSTRGFTQTFHFWKENRRAQSVPFNAYLTYVTLPWFNIITDILDHETGPILTF